MHTGFDEGLHDPMVHDDPINNRLFGRISKDKK
jgi:hypothetical protein